MRRIAVAALLFFVALALQGCPDSTGPGLCYANPIPRDSVIGGGLMDSAGAVDTTGCF